MTVRTRILETAAGLLAQSADADVSTRAVCDAAGVTAPTLYHHFGDKDGLLAAVDIAYDCRTGGGCGGGGRAGRRG